MKEKENEILSLSKNHHRIQEALREVSPKRKLLHPDSHGNRDASTVVVADQR
jgi:hypothetical protein